MKRFLVILIVATLIATLAGCGGSQQTQPKDTSPIKIGGIFDLTGATGDVGTPYSEGARAYIEYVNGKGGVNGRKIDLVWQDYQYKVPQAVDLYKKLTTQDKVVSILGWGTGDTEAMKELIAKDKVPYVSGSYSANLQDPKVTPYNFVVAPTYSDQARLALKWIKDTRGKAKVAFVYNDTPFGKSPLEDAKKYAQEIGLEWVGEAVVALNATEATSQLLDLQKKGTDFALIQETTNATVVVLKDAKKLGLKTQFIGLNWAADDGVVKAAAEAAEGYIGVVPFAFAYETDRPGIKELQEYLQGKQQKLEAKPQKYVQGWVSARVIVEAVKNVKGDVNGESIRAALEQFKDLDLGGLAAPVTFSATDHAGAKRTKLYQVKGGKFTPITDWISLK